MDPKALKIVLVFEPDYFIRDRGKILEEHQSWTYQRTNFTVENFEIFGGDAVVKKDFIVCNTDFADPSLIPVLIFK
jgi:hypothetical protein